MPRIRTIKPEFPQSESMGRVSRDARLTFILLWTLADDSGRLRGNSRMLASLLYPYDEDSRSLFPGWLDELERENCVYRYKCSEGHDYLEICNWEEHQKIDKPSKSKLPAPPSRTFAKPREESPTPREHSSGDQGPRIKDQGSRKGGEGNGAVANALPPDLPEWVVEPWQRFMNHIFALTGKHLTFDSHNANLMEVLRRGPEKGLRDIEFSIQKNCKTLRDSDNDYEKRGSGGSGSGTERKTRGQQALEAMGL